VSDLAVWWVFGAYAALVGLVIGSFLNTVIHRLPEDRSVVRPRSHCPHCHATIRPKDIIPILSWLLLRGRCRACQGRISAHYPLIELLTALLAWLAYVRLVPDAHALDLAHGAAWVVFFGFLALLVVVTYVDVRHHIILDQTSIYAVPFGIAGIGLLQALGYEGWLAISWKEAVLGACAGGLLFAMLAVVVLYVYGREGLGWGDVKLMAMIGAFLGPLPGAFTALLLGSLAGATFGVVYMIARRRRAMLPMGPALALGAVVYVLYGDLILDRLLPGVGQWREVLSWVLSGR